LRAGDCDSQARFSMASGFAHSSIPRPRSLPCLAALLYEHWGGLLNIGLLIASIAWASWGLGHRPPLRSAHTRRARVRHQKSCRCVVAFGASIS
jgi:hypothetical protein